MQRVIRRRLGAGGQVLQGDVFLSALPASPGGGESVVSWISGPVRLCTVSQLQRHTDAIVVSSLGSLERALALHCLVSGRSH